MTVERTEAAGESGLLTLSCGGQPVTLRVLTIAESDAWLDKLGTALASMDVGEEDDERTGDQMLRDLLTQASRAALDLVVAYDIDGVLGGRDAIRASMTKVELKDALETMVTVEDPLGPASARSVGVVFGGPSLVLEAALTMTMAAAPMLRLVRSASSLSDTGDATTLATSGPSGPASSSSSAGRTRRTASAVKTTSAAS